MGRRRRTRQSSTASPPAAGLRARLRERAAHASVARDDPTGLEPDQHGVHDNGVRPAARAPDRRRAARRPRLRHGGVRRGVRSRRELRPRSGVRALRRRDHVEGRPAAFRGAAAAGEDVTDRALAWLARRAGAVLPLGALLRRAPAAGPRAAARRHAGPLRRRTRLRRQQIGRLLDGLATREAVTSASSSSSATTARASASTTRRPTASSPTMRRSTSRSSSPGRDSPPGGGRTRSCAPPTSRRPSSPPPVRRRSRRDRAVAGRRLAADGDDDWTAYFECFGPAYGWAGRAWPASGRRAGSSRPSPSRWSSTTRRRSRRDGKPLHDEPAIVERLGIGAPDQVDGGQAAGSRPRRSRPSRRRLAALGYVDVPQHSRRRVPDPRRFVGDGARRQGAHARRRRTGRGEHPRAQGARLESIARPLALDEPCPTLLAHGPPPTPSERPRHSSRSPRADARSARPCAARPRPRRRRARRPARVNRRRGCAVASRPRVRARILLQLGRPADAPGVLGNDLHDDEALALASRAHAARTRPERDIAAPGGVRAAPPGARLVETRAVLAALLDEDGRIRSRPGTRGGSAPTARVSRQPGRDRRPARQPGASRSALPIGVADRPAMQLYRRQLIETYERSAGAMTRSRSTSR